MKPAQHSNIVADLIEKVCGSPPKRGIEIGVERGRTSEHLLKRFPDLHLTAIDPWQAGYTHPNKEIVHWAERIRRRPEQEAPGVKQTRYLYRPQEEFDSIRLAAYKMFRRHRRRVTILKMSSGRAVTKISGQFDFIFIDGDHTRCGRDIQLYWRFVRPGGLLAGHDYGTNLSLRGYWDVNKAVDKHEQRTGIKVMVESAFVWGFKKPETRDVLQ